MESVDLDRAEHMVISRVDRIFNRLCDFQLAAEKYGIGPEWAAISHAAPQGLNYEVLPEVASAVDAALIIAAQLYKEDYSTGLSLLQNVARKLKWVSSLSHEWLVMEEWQIIEGLDEIVEIAENYFMEKGILPKSRASDRFSIKKMEELGLRRRAMI